MAKPMIYVEDVPMIEWLADLEGNTQFRLPSDLREQDLYLVEAMFAISMARLRDGMREREQALLGVTQ